jgi:small GTP-binding protein
MGNFFTRTWSSIFASKKDVRILLVGLDAVGKTTIMYKLKMNETVKTIPTVGFNVETMSYKNLTMTMWDVGGQDRIRALWDHYYPGTDAVIYVVDSADTERLDQSANELHKMLEHDDLKNAHVLVYANKQDLNGAISPNEVAEKMRMSSLKGRLWNVQGTSAVVGSGLTEGLDWLAKIMK